MHINELMQALNAFKPPARIFVQSLRGLDRISDPLHRGVLQHPHRGDVRQGPGRQEQPRPRPRPFGGLNGDTRRLSRPIQYSSEFSHQPYRPNHGARGYRSTMAQPEPMDHAKGFRRGPQPHTNKNPDPRGDVRQFYCPAQLPQPKRKPGNSSFSSQASNLRNVAQRDCNRGMPHMHRRNNFHEPDLPSCESK